MAQNNKVKYGLKVTISLLLILFALFSGLFYILFKNQVDSSVTKIKKDLFWKPRKLISKEVNSAQVVQKWFSYWQFPIPKELKFLESEDWEKLECWNTETDGGLFFEKDISAQFKDPVLLKVLKQIKNREYRDADIYSEKVGKLALISQGKNAKKNIIYESLCKARGNYLIVFTTTDIDLSVNAFVKTAFAGGGGYWGPQNLAIVSDKEIKIIERIGKSRSVAYWNCTEIIGITDSNLYLRCGGGDGSAAASSINRMDLGTQKNSELVYCQVGPGKTGKTEVKCFNGEDKLFFERTGSI